MTELNVKKMLEENENKSAPEETKAQDTKPLNLNNLSVEQIQNLKELFARTPTRATTENKYHTVQLRKIKDKIIIGWEQTYFAKKRDAINHMDVMKTIIPVMFEGSKAYTDVLWREEFMESEKVTCKILKMDTKEERRAVGITYARGDSGEKTQEQVERYVVDTKITYTIELPDGKNVEIDSRFIN